MCMLSYYLKGANFCTSHSWASWSKVCHIPPDYCITIDPNDHLTIITDGSKLEKDTTPNLFKVPKTEDRW